jgi:hypothetical protein
MIFEKPDISANLAQGPKTALVIVLVTDTFRTRSDTDFRLLVELIIDMNVHNKLFGLLIVDDLGSFCNTMWSKIARFILPAQQSPNKFPFREIR